MKYFLRLLVLLGPYIIGIAPAFAELSYGPFSLSAFGTFGGALLSSDDASYVQGTQPSGPGLNHQFDLGLDSRLGAQLNVSLTPSTLITVQSVVERLSNNEFLPRLTQANIRQEIGENFAIRIGRMQSPAFLASDYRLANFSNPWVRTPGEVYNLFPLIHLDSADFTIRHDTELGTLGLNAGYGWVDYPFPITTNGNTLNTAGAGTVGTANVSVNDLFFTNLKLDNGPWRFKISWLHARSSINVPDLNQLTAGLASLDPVAAKQLGTV